MRAPRFLQRGRLQGLAESAKVLWRGPSPAPTPRSAAGDAGYYATRLALQKAPPQSLADRAKVLWRGPSPAPTPRSAAGDAGDYAARLALQKAPPQSLVDRAKRFWRGRAAPTQSSANPAAPTQTSANPARAPTPTTGMHLEIEKRRTGPYRRPIRPRVTMAGFVLHLHKRVARLESQFMRKIDLELEHDEKNFLKWFAEGLVPVLLSKHEKVIEDHVVQLKVQLKDYVKKIVANSEGEDDIPECVSAVLAPW